MSVRQLSVAPTLPASAWTWPRAATPAFPLGDDTCRLFSQSRQGLWQALSRLRPEDGDELLVPAYHHGSEIETVKAVGFLPRFYGGGDTLEPKEDELNALAGPATRGLYLIHPLGFAHDSPRWRAWCDQRAIALVEDGAQAWLSRREGVPVGTAADISIFCIYKTVGVPDGGVVRTSPAVGSVRPAPGAPGFEPLPVLRAHRRYLEQRIGRLARSRQPGPGDYQEDPDRDFAPTPHLFHASWASRYLACRVAGDETAARRRRNFCFLENRLGDHRSGAFGPLHEGASPLAFPVESDDKRGMLDHLARRGITGGAAWTVRHPLLPAAGFPLAANLRNRLVGLPVHQELREPDLEQIAEAAREWYAASGR